MLEMQKIQKEYTMQDENGKNGKFTYNKLLSKKEILEYLVDNLVAIEGLEEVTEEDLKKLFQNCILDSNKLGQN